jgi:hypothetical protein
MDEGCPVKVVRHHRGGARWHLAGRPLLLASRLYCTSLFRTLEAATLIVANRPTAGR